MRGKSGGQRVRRVNRGISLIEVAMGLGVMSLVALGTVRLVEDQNQATRALGAATQLEQVRSSVNDWMRANYQQLVANLPVGGGPVLIPVARTVPGGAMPGPVTIGGATFPSLQGGGFIPATVTDRNPYGQSHAVMVRQSAAGTLEALVVQTGGQPIRDGDLGRIVSRMGSAGGARFQNNANPAMANMVQGGGGAWQADTAVWTSGGVTPQVSRAAASVNFGNASMLSDFLNRYDIGVPEANTMRTAVNMGNNDINNAATVRANSAVLQNGGNACAGNATGCSFWISDDGRFSDFNDGWVRFQASYAGGGLTVEGPAGSGNLWVGGTGWFNSTLGAAGNITSGADISAARNLSAGQDLWVGRDASVSRNLGVANDIWSGRDIGATRNISAANNIWAQNALSANGNLSIGGNAGIAGTLGANQVWTTYVNSSGSVNTQTLNVGQSAAVWGTGGLYVASNFGVGGSASINGSLNVGGGISASGNIGTGNNLNASGRVVGAQGVQTYAWRSPGAWCNWGGDEAGLIGISTWDGSLVSCTSSWTWQTGGGPLGVVRGGWGFGGFGCDPGYYYNVLHFNVGNTNNAFIPFCIRHGN